MTRIPFDKMKKEIKNAFLSAGMTDKKADLCAQIHTESSCDGVYSHGLNRVSRFVNHIKNGWVDINAEPTFVKSFSFLKNFDGNKGPGILNALFSMDKAIEIAEKNGIGIVSLRNTTHWMRGGTYGWQAANKGYIGICWTNTESCMPAWGAKNSKIGNNPFIISVPRKNGEHVVLDIAMSQFSYGKLQVTRLKNEKLPFPGGYDKNGNLTSEPELIEKSGRILPMGYWKGSGLAIVLDLVASLLAGGLTTAGVDKENMGNCGGCSQIFIAIDPYKVLPEKSADNLINEVIKYLKTSEQVNKDIEVTYPGERTIKTRKDNMKNGIPIDDDVWNEILNL